MPKSGPKPPGRQRHTPSDRRIKKQLGANLRRARKAIGLEQEALAEALDIPESTLNKYEYGVSFPKPAHFEAFIDIGISVHYLFTGLGQPTTGPVDITTIHKLRRAN